MDKCLFFVDNVEIKYYNEDVGGYPQRRMLCYFQ